ncbi:LOW QUALITY PROTEIN: 4-hydroxybenzoate 3-monooxygenase, partial [Micromonospora sp. ATCC 39149]
PPGHASRERGHRCGRRAVPSPARVRAGATPRQRSVVQPIHDGRQILLTFDAWVTDHGHHRGVRPPRSGSSPADPSIRRLPTHHHPCSGRASSMKKVMALGLIAATAIALTGCTDSDASTPSEKTSGELRKVRVAALPITETAALWGGIKAGIFAERGLQVEVLPAQGGAQAIPALLNGDIDFAIGQPFGPIRADLRNLGVVIIGNYASSYADGDDINAVVASAKSGIKRPADLAGKRVSVNSLGAAGDVTIMATVEKDGGDPSTIKFVEVAFPDAPAQLEAGNIDAAWVPEPFVTQLKSRGDTFVVAPYQAVVPGLTTLTTITTRERTEKDATLVADFSAAMRKTLEWAKDPANETAVRQAIKDNLQLPAPVAESVKLPAFGWQVDRSSLQTLAELARKYKVLDQQPNFDRLIHQQ